MALVRCDFVSEALSMETSMLVVLPDKGDIGEAPVIYLLHGLTDNCTAWQRYTRAEAYARQYGAVLVMPEVQRSFYTDMYAGPKYFTYVSEELPRVCARLFGISQKPEKSYVMGLSMGGYGALKCALRNPKRYAGCAAFSAVTDPGELLLKNISGIKERNEGIAIFGKTACPMPQDDIFALAKPLCANKALPPIMLCCGIQDSLIEMNRRLRDYIAENGAMVQYSEWQGAHSWEFWDEALRLAMKHYLSRG